MLDLTQGIILLIVGIALYCISFAPIPVPLPRILQILGIILAVVGAVVIVLAVLGIALFIMPLAGLGL